VPSASRETATESNGILTYTLDRYLNGRGRGARYDGSFSGSTRVGSCSGMTGSGASFSADYKVGISSYGLGYGY
jgi:hypothetical protein